MRKSVKSVTFRLLSLALALTLMFSVFVVAGPAASGVGDESTNNAKVGTLGMNVYATYGTDKYLPYDFSEGASGYFKVVATPKEVFSANLVYYRLNGTTEWTAAGIFSDESKPAATVDEVTPVTSKVSFQIKALGEGQCKYDLLFSNMDKSEEGKNDSYRAHLYENALTLNHDNKIDSLTFSDSDDEKFVKSHRIRARVEDKSGIESITFTYNGNDYPPTNVDGTAFSYIVKEDFVGDVTIAIKDKAGYTEYTTRHVMVDTTAPTVALTGTDEYWGKDKVVIKGNAQDDAAGVAEVRYAVFRAGKTVSVNPETDPKVDFDETTGDFEVEVDRDSVPADEAGEKDGKFNVVVYAVDAAGNTPKIASNYKGATVNFETKKCVIVELESDTPSYTRDMVTVSGKVKDSESGFNAENPEKSVMFRITYTTGRVGEWTPVHEAKVNEAGELEFKAFFNDKDKKYANITTSGDYKVEFIAYDKVGNDSTLDEVLASKITYPLEIHIDRVGPVLDESSVKMYYSNSKELTDGVYTNSMVTIEGTYSDEYTGLSKVAAVATGTKTVETVDITSTEDPKVFKFKAVLPALNYTGAITLKGYDGLGNIQVKELAKPVVYMDKKGPVINAADIKADDEDFVRQTTVRGKITDAAAGVKSVFYKKSADSEWTEVPAENLSFSDGGKTVDFAFKTLEGDNYNGYYDIKAEDKAGEVTEESGNVTTRLKAVRVKVENTAPQVDSIKVDFTGDWTNGDLTFTVKASDVGSVRSGVKLIKYSFADNDKYPQNVEVSEKDGSGSFTFTIKASELSKASGMGGGYAGKLRVVAVDNAGNETKPENGKTAEIKVDTEKGTATVVTESLSWTNKERTVTVSFVDNASDEDYNSGYSKVEYAEDDNVWKAITPVIDGDSYTLTFATKNYNGSYKIRFYDKAGNVSDEVTVDKAKQDTVAPKVDGVTASPTDWTNGTVTFTGTASDLGTAEKEDNSGVAAIFYKKSTDAEWTQLPEGSLSVNDAEKTAEFTLTVPADSYNGTYEFKAVDNATNESATLTSEAIKQDNLAPSVNDDFRIDVVEWTRGQVTIKGTVSDYTDTVYKDYNSGISKVFYKKSADEGWIELAATEFAVDDTTKSASYTITLEPQNYLGTYEVKCVDVAGNESAALKVFDLVKNTDLIKQDIEAPKIAVEHSAPNTLFTILENISLGLFNFNDENSLRYTITLTDNLSGLDMDSLMITYTDEKGETHTEKLESLFVCDKETLKTNDDYAPTEVKVEFTVDRDMYLENVSFSINDKVIDTDKNNGDGSDEGIKIVDRTDPTRTIHYSEPVNSTLSDSSDLSDSNVTEDQTLYYNGSAALTFTVEEKNFYPAENKVGAEIAPQCKFKVTRDGKEITDYALTDWSKDSDSVYSSKLTLTGDGTYEVDFTYTDYSNNEMTAFKSATVIIDDTKPVSEVTYSNKTVQNTIDGVDYFQNKQVATVTITEKNFNAEDVKFNITAKNSKDNDVVSAYSIGSWSNSGDKHTVDVTFDGDANFTFDFDYTDLAMNAMDDFAQYKFTVDNKAPELTKINYSKSVRDVIIDTVTFGYYDAPVTVTLEYFDETSGCYTYNREGTLDPKASSIHKAIEKLTSDVTVSDPVDGVTTISFTVPESLTEKNNFDGTLNTFMRDRSKNLAETKNNTDSSLDTGRRIIVDTIAPVASIEVAKPVNTVESGGKVTRYYDGNYKSTIKIEEAHFDSSLVDFKIDGKDVALTWKKTGDVNTADFTISDEGVHSYVLNCTDLSNNKGNEVKLENIVIDKTNPVVNVSYANKNAINNINGRKYFDSTQTATVKITETNFRSSDVNIIVKATNSSGGTVSSPYTQGSWKDKGDEHTLVLTYSKDANLSFDIEYKDLALRSISNYAEDLFTVDTTDPQTISFSYSNPVNTKNGKQFYNGAVTVTITCFDATSGVYTFDYEGILASGASSSNAAVVKSAISNASITTNGGTSTATFTIPASALSSINQFDGTITAVAHDRSGNTTTTKDTTELVCDNIDPTATIKVSDPVQTSGGKRYYGGTITVNFSLTEANFTDATTTVTVDGTARSVTWSPNDNSSEVHTASTTISGDGTHTVTLSCTDASNNGMTDVTEKDMIIDTKDPEIKIKDTILNASANKEDTLSFDLEVTDENIVASDIKPSLKAVVTEAKEDKPDSTISELKEKDISLVAENSAGKTITYHIDNLSTDGFYTFTCTAKDLANNSSSKVNCTGSDKKTATVEAFNFSVNRHGSTYWVEANVDNDDFTNSNEISVALHEINIDKLSNDTKLRITDDNSTTDVKLNNSNFEKDKQTDKQPKGGWYESVYSLDNSYFAEDSRYSVEAISHDTANNLNVSSDHKLSVISFTVDRTAPVITSNVSDGKSINADEFDVEFKIAENYLDKETVKVKVNGKDTKFSETSGGGYKFTIGSGTTESIEISASDLAKNPAKVYKVSGITVSTNPLVLWFANKPLFFSTTGGAVLLAALIVFLVVFNKKRKAKQAQG